jgi:NADH dehydrogenase FAD-containing subunit
MSRVAEVREDSVTVTIKNPKDKNAEPHPIEIPAGFVLWSTGIGMSLPL